MMKTGAGRRVDQWLFFARLCKSRSLAGRLVEAGRIRINREKVTKPAALVHQGDVITAMINQKLRIVEVVELGARRGPAAEAVGLYSDLTPKEETPRKGRLIGATSPSRPKGAGRPTKKDRRKMDLLKPNPDD